LRITDGTPELYGVSNKDSRPNTYQNRKAKFRAKVNLNEEESSGLIPPVS
jgi:hypothetical protein